MFIFRDTSLACTFSSSLQGASQCGSREKILARSSWKLRMSSSALSHASNLNWRMAMKIATVAPTVARALTMSHPRAQLPADSVGMLLVIRDGILFGRAAGCLRCAGEGELVLGLTHYGRILADGLQGVKRQVLLVLGGCASQIVPRSHAFH